MTVINLNEKRQPVKFTIHITANYDGTFETLVEDVSDSPESRNAVCDILVRLAETYLNRKVEAAADDMLAIMLANIDHAMNLTEENPAVFNVTAQELSTWAEAVAKYESQRF